jgi:hypothetical protein
MLMTNRAQANYYHQAPPAASYRGSNATKIQLSMTISRHLAYFSAEQHLRRI